jgi:hypothetical protein
MKTSKAHSLGLGKKNSPKASNLTSPLKRTSPKGSSLAPKKETELSVMRRLDIDPAEVARVPREVSEILNRCFSNGTKNFPRQRIFEYSALSSHPCAIAFTRSVQSIRRKSDLRQLSFEALCVHAHVNPVELLGAILMSAKTLKGTESTLKAIMAHPDVVQATLDAATSGDPVVVGGQVLRDKNGELIRYKGDVAAQRLVHEFSATRFLPVSKGGSIEINFGLGRPAEEREEQDTDADREWDDAFPDMGEAIHGWSADKHRLLESGK